MKHSCIFCVCSQFGFSSFPFICLCAVVSRLPPSDCLPSSPVTDRRRPSAMVTPAYRFLSKSVSALGTTFLFLPLYSAGACYVSLCHLGHDGASSVLCALNRHFGSHACSMLTRALSLRRPPPSPGLAFSTPHTYHQCRSLSLSRGRVTGYVTAPFCVRGYGQSSCSCCFLFFFFSTFCFRRYWLRSLRLAGAARYELFPRLAKWLFATPMPGPSGWSATGEL